MPPPSPTAGASPQAPSSAPASRAVLVLSLAWPLAIWLGLRLAGVRGLSLVVVAGVAGALVWHRLGRPRATGRATLLLVPALLLAALALASEDVRWLLSWPVLVSLGVALAFGWSLRPGSTPLVERFARKLGDPPPGAEVHCRQFTVAWALFGLGNATVAGWLAALGRVDAWAFWTGFGSYAAMALLFALERGVRYARFERPAARQPSGARK